MSQKHSDFDTQKTRWTFILLLILLTIATVWLRLGNLGYSNFQGDEIKALCKPIEGQTLVRFLLGQRKGPVQFLISCLYGVFDPAFSSELAIRLPFAVASVLAVVVFYLLVRQYFNRTVSVSAALFLATNGLLVALGRIVQYQSITVLCSLLAIYSLSCAIQAEKWKITGLYLGFFSASLGVLAHFDGVYVFLPMLYLLYLWWRKYKGREEFPRYRNHLIMAIGIAAIPLFLFYIPFVLNLDNYQLGYWEKRLTTATNSNTWSLFRFYNPGPIVGIYAILLVLGITRLRVNRSSIILVLWAVPPILIMELVMSNAGTHFYTYLLPLFVVAGLGVDTLQNGLKRIFKTHTQQLVEVGCIFLFGFFFIISHLIFINHTPEYPWQPKSFLGMIFPGGNLAGTFGFPYNRGWREIEAWITENYDADILLATNEKESLSRFYFPASRQLLDGRAPYSNDLALDHGILVLWVEQPQSWIDNIMGLDHEKWQNQGTYMREFRNEDSRLNATLYFLTKAEIQSLFP